MEDQENNDSLRTDLENAFKEVEERQQVDNKVEKEPEVVEEVKDTDKELPLEPKRIEAVKVEDDAPAALSAVAKAKWPELPPEIKQEWSKREADFHKMVTSHDGELRMGREMKEVISPYMPIIQAEGGTPATAVRDLLNTAYVLRTGSPQQKTQILHQVAQQYGIDISSPIEQTYVDPTIQNLQREIEQLKQMSNPSVIYDQLNDRYENERISSEIKAFASDPSNKYYEQVRPLMASMLDSGVFHDMKEAYDAACWANPSVRSMLEADKSAALKAKQTQDMSAKRRAAASVTGSPGSIIPNSNVKNKTVEEELRAAFASYDSIN